MRWQEYKRLAPNDMRNICFRNVLLFLSASFSRSLAFCIARNGWCDVSWISTKQANIIISTHKSMPTQSRNEVHFLFVLFMRRGSWKLAEARNVSVGHFVVYLVGFCMCRIAKPYFPWSSEFRTHLQTHKKTSFFCISIDDLWSQYHRIHVVAMKSSLINSKSTNTTAHIPSKAEISTDTMQPLQ